MKTVLLTLALFGTAQAACDTDFLLPPGIFTYQSPDLGTETIRNVVTAKGVQSTTTLDGDTNTATYVCQNGHIRLTDGKTSADLSMFPQGDQWRPGYTWNYQTKGSAASMDLTVNGTGRIVSLDHITTPAGTFDAYRLDVTYSLKVSGNLGNKLGKLPKSALARIMAPHKGSFWFARGVGLVKEQSEISRTLVKVGH